jgi:hypothetical protein
MYDYHKEGKVIRTLRSAQTACADVLKDFVIRGSAKKRGKVFVWF